MRDLEAWGGKESREIAVKDEIAAVGGGRQEIKDERESGETSGEIKKDRSCAQSAASCNTNAKQPKNCLFPGLNDVADYGGGETKSCFSGHLFRFIKMFPGNNVFRSEKPNFLFF